MNCTVHEYAGVYVCVCVRVFGCASKLVLYICGFSESSDGDKCICEAFSSKTCLL